MALHSIRILVDVFSVTSAILSMIVFDNRKRNQVVLDQVGWKSKLSLIKGKNMRHGPEEVRWLKRRNSEVAAILRLSTMKSDQTSREDLRNWVDLGNDACHVPQ